MFDTLNKKGLYKNKKYVYISAILCCASNFFLQNVNQAQTWRKYHSLLNTQIFRLKNPGGFKGIKAH